MAQVMYSVTDKNIPVMLAVLLQCARFPKLRQKRASTIDSWDSMQKSYNRTPSVLA